MTTVIALREPFRTFFNDLDCVHFTVDSHRPQKVNCGIWSVGPELDPEDAKQLAAELEAAIAPVMKRFKERKLAEVMALLSPGVPAGQVMRLR